MEPRVIICMFLRQGTKGYRLWCIESERALQFIISRGVKFYKSSMFSQKEKLGSHTNNRYQGANLKL